MRTTLLIALAALLLGADYPEPTTKYLGLTAKEWNEKEDWHTGLSSVPAREAMPFVLERLEKAKEAKKEAKKEGKKFIVEQMTTMRFVTRFLSNNINAVEKEDLDAIGWLMMNEDKSIRSDFFIQYRGAKPGKLRPLVPKFIEYRDANKGTAEWKRFDDLIKNHK